MKKCWIILLAMVVSVMCSALTMPFALAAGEATLSIPVEISLSGTLPDEAETFTICLEAMDAGNPMPEGASGKVYRMTLSGEGTKNLPSIAFDKVGKYAYRVYQVAGINEKCTYDDTVYTLDVSVTNNADYTDLEVTAVLSPNSDEAKASGAAFENEYEIEIEPSESPKTGDESSPMLYAILILVSLGVIVSLLLTRKSKKSEG